MCNFMILSQNKYSKYTGPGDSDMLRIQARDKNLTGKIAKKMYVLL